MTKIESGSTRRDASQSDTTTNNTTTQKPSKQKGHDSPPPLPLVVALNCLEDCNLEEEALSGLARIRYVRLAHISDGSIESAIAVLLHSLTFLPRAAQRRLQPCQLILCLGSVDKSADSSLASELGLHLLHVDTSRAEEVADTVMALVLGLLRHTHSLAKKGPGASIGGLESLCRGMRRCRGLVMGIIGRSASACALASRTLAFKMKVIYFEVEEGKDGVFHRRYNFPLSARKVENLHELLGASDVVSLHCSLTTETLQLMNAEAFQHLKPGAIIINTGSNHLLDDCALKQSLIDGTVAGCALDGVEGPQWMEAWVREMPNVLILPRSSEYSEEVWMEIRAKAVTILRSFLLDGVVPSSAVSDEDEDEREGSWQEEKAGDTENAMHHELKNINEELHSKQMPFKTPDPRRGQRVVGGHIKGSAKKGKRRSGRRKSQKGMESLATERDANWAALQRDDASMSGSTQMLSSNSRFASPDEVRSRVDEYPYAEECASEEQSLLFLKKRHAIDMLRDGYVIALRTQDSSGYHIARRCGPEKGWYLDTVPNITVRDPAAQFLVVIRGKERIGLRSLAAGGKMLQANKKMELLFVSHGFDTYESWVLEGTTLDDCKLTSCKMRTVSLNIAVEILAILGEEDGVARWLD